MDKYHLPSWLLKAITVSGGFGLLGTVLAVSGSTLTVWQLDRGSTVWAKAQSMSVPIQYGSSS